MRRISTFILAALIIAVAFIPLEAGQKTLGDERQLLSYNMSGTTYASELEFFRQSMKDIDQVMLKVTVTGLTGGSASSISVYPSFSSTVGEALALDPVGVQPPDGASAVSLLITTNGTYYAMLTWGINHFNSLTNMWPPYLVFTLTEDRTGGTIVVEAIYSRWN